MKTIQVYELILKLKKLDQQKQKKIEELLLHSKENKFISEEIRNFTVLELTKELRQIEDQINEIYSYNVEVENDFKPAK